MKKKILIIVSNANVIGPHHRRTGTFLPEVAHPYAAFDKASYQIDFIRRYTLPGCPEGGGGP